jgi:outer membrane protein assembly factor BamB
MARCFSAVDGKLLWETRLPGEFRDEFYMSSVALADGVAILTAGNLFGLDAATGKLLWTHPDAKGQHASAAVWSANGKSRALINISGGSTICVEPRTGKELWRFASQANHSTPIVVGDNRLIVYGSSRKAGLRCLEISDAGAKELWVYNGCGDQGSSPVVVAGHVYVQGERRLACVDLNTGEEKWQTQLNLKDPRYASLLAADGKIFYAQEGLLVFAADPSAFKPLFDARFDKTGLMASEAYFRKVLNLDELEKTDARKADQLYSGNVEKFGPLKCHTPAFSDGKLFLRTNDSILCYDLSQSTRT